MYISSLFFTKLDDVGEGWIEEEIAKHPEFAKLNEEIDTEVQRIMDELKDSDADPLTKIGRVGELLYGVAADEFINDFKDEFYKQPNDFPGIGDTHST